MRASHFSTLAARAFTGDAARVIHSMRHDDAASPSRFSARSRQYAFAGHYVENMRAAKRITAAGPPRRSIGHATSRHGHFDKAEEKRLAVACRRARLRAGISICTLTLRNARRCHTTISRQRKSPRHWVYSFRLRFAGAASFSAPGRRLLMPKLCRRRSSRPLFRRQLSEARTS